MFKMSKRALLRIFSVALVLLVLSACGQKADQVTILYTADTHGQLAGTEQSTGIDVIAAVREGTPNSLLLDAGDFTHGNVFVNLSEGKHAVTLMKMAGYFAAALGNHEFDFGQAALQARVAEALAGPRPMHILSANVLKADGSPLVEPAVITTVNGLKIGIFGLTTQETATQSHADSVRGLVFADVKTTAANMSKMLRGQGCDLVIALSHVGSESSKWASSTEIADQVPGIDVIIDGHSHVKLDYTAPNGTLVVSSGERAHNLGKLELTFDRGTNTLKKQNMLLKPQDVANVAPDAAVRAELLALREQNTAIMAAVVAHSELYLEGGRALVRTQETALGSLCADSLAWASGAEIAIINGGSIRASIKQGPVTFGAVADAFPFGGDNVTKKVTGAQLKEILEHAYSKLPKEDGGFAQISGLRVTLDLKKPTGQRVVSLALPDNKPVAPHKTYTLALGDFLALGGDGYPVLKELPMEKSFPPTSEIFTRYLSQGKGIFAKLNGQRIIIKNN